MLDFLQDAPSIAGHIREAAARTTESLAERAINQEPHFTDRLLARIEDAINEAPGTRARWIARTLTDRGRRAEESVIGADFHGAFEVFTSEMRVAKGFLAQAKLLAPSAALSASEHSRLQEQCQRMLDVSPASFVFLYSTSGVRVASATTVVSGSERVREELGTKSIDEFFLETTSGASSVTQDLATRPLSID